MTKRKSVPQQHVAAEAQGTEKLWPPPGLNPTAPVVPAAPMAGVPVRSFDNIDWMQVTAQVATKPDPDWLARMDHSWDARIKAIVMRAWKKQARFDVLQYAAARPVTELGVVLLTPCQSGDEGWTPVRPDGKGAIVRLQTGLRKFGLNWPKDEAILFPVFIRETQYGCSLILDVAGKSFDPIKKQDPKPKDGTDKKPQ